MDCDAALELPAAPTGAQPPVAAAQAVFTSLPSPIARGYRIVAASRGLTPEEKREITRRAPSHQSLCDPAPTASGLASFPLPSGRWALFFTRHAGAEPSARGGFRVQTHVVVLEPADFARFAWDPLRVEAAAAEKTAALCRRPPADRLPPLSVRVPPIDVAGTGPPPDEARKWITPASAILAAVLAGRNLLVSDVPGPREVLGCVLAGIPAFRRARLSLSCGLKFAPGRLFQLVLMGSGSPSANRGAGPPGTARQRPGACDAEPRGPALRHSAPTSAFRPTAGRGDPRAAHADIRRLIAGLEIDHFLWDAPPGDQRSRFAVWLRFVRLCWRTGRQADLARLTAGLTEELDPVALGRVARGALREFRGGPAASRQAGADKP